MAEPCSTSRKGDWYHLLLPRLQMHLLEIVKTDKPSEEAIAAVPDFGVRRSKQLSWSMMDLDFM